MPERRIATLQLPMAAGEFAQAMLEAAAEHPEARIATAEDGTVIHLVVDEPEGARAG